jgi:hypothetical protein
MEEGTKKKGRTGGTEEVLKRKCRNRYPGLEVTGKSGGAPPGLAGDEKISSEVISSIGLSDLFLNV